MSMTPEQMQAWSLQRELDERNRPLTDDEIDAVLPDGYKVCKALYNLCLNGYCVCNWCDALVQIEYIFGFI